MTSAFNLDRIHVDLTTDDVAERPAPYDGPVGTFVLTEAAGPQLSGVIADSSRTLRAGARYRLPADHPQVVALLESGAIEPAPERVAIEPRLDVARFGRRYDTHPDVAPLATKAAGLARRAAEAEDAATAADADALSAEKTLADVRTQRVLDEATDADVVAAESKVETHRAAATRSRDEAAAVRRAQDLVEHQADDARNDVWQGDLLATDAAAAALYAEAAEMAVAVSDLVARAQRLTAGARSLPQATTADGRHVGNPEGPELQLIGQTVVSPRLRTWLAEFREQADRLELELPGPLPNAAQWPADVVDLEAE